ncbi:DISEASE RESISTANCE PROTEIN RFL1-RELATED [Salix koriyanagi]|uniref:DISEASE RESISTANCE PROTEIN RFL1-RELATED n=1 Tax=Salix koriyanagi TaxID=2511006 RepID=A0A9Q1A3X5_9ROSI|nr:DISEASE RESISTANCE PROTEIN RFL1-RELATED [Salix koriyanagi]
MANIPIGELLTFLWNVIKEPVAYIDYEQNLRTLETKMHELLHLKDDLTKNVQMAEPHKRCRRTALEAAVLRTAGPGEKYLSSVPSPVESVMRCLCESEKSTIGIYGPGGVGKTALLTQVSNNLLSSQLQFDFVISVVASQDPDSERIQGDIGKEIGFLEDRWKGKSFQQKARELSSVLSQKKFVLLLDDLWKPVDLAEVGVPSRENGSKLVFTTRSEELCNSMGAEEKIRVGGLAWDKAWKLFQEKVGEDTLNIHPEIP